MKLQALCRRTTWEIVRDPLNLAFGLGFPLVLLLLLSAIQANVPVDLFAIDRLTPGISVFGLAFIALFSATYFAMAMTLSTRCPVSAEMNTDGAYDMKVSSLAISFLKSFIV